MTSIPSNGIGNSPRPVGRSTRSAQQSAGREREAFAPPPRAEVDFIPSEESLATLIRSALSALRQGVYWDRGSILNVLA